MEQQAENKVALQILSVEENAGRIHLVCTVLSCCVSMLRSPSPRKTSAFPELSTPHVYSSDAPRTAAKCAAMSCADPMSLTKTDGRWRADRSHWSPL